MADKYISPEARREAEAEGETGYGESFPMRNCDEVRRAIQSYGRAPEGKRAQLRRAIARRRKELGCDGSELPETWYAGERNGSHMVLTSKRKERAEPDSGPDYKMKPKVRRKRSDGD